MTPVVAVVDRTDVLHDAVRSVRRALDPPPDVEDVRRHSDFDLGGVRADVLVLGRRELTQAGLKRARRWSAEHPDAVVVAHLPARGTTAPPAAVLREHGVSAWFRGEPTEAVLLRLLRDALTEPLPEPELPPVAEAAGEPEPAPEPEREPATVVTVCSASGGSGKTLVATNLALAAATPGTRVLLVDLALQFGGVGAALQSRHPYSVYDGLYDASGRPLPDAALAEHLDELVVHSPLGVDLLLAPRDPALADAITADDVAHVLATARRRYDVVVLDTPSGLSGHVLAALDASTTVVVLTSLDVPALRSLRSFLDLLTELGVGESRRRLLLNKVDSDVGIDVAQAQDVFGGRFVAALPLSRTASRSLNTGKVAVRSEPRSAFVRELREAVGLVLPAATSPAGVDTTVPVSRMRGFLRVLRPSPGGTS